MNMNMNINMNMKIKMLDLFMDDRLSQRNGKISKSIDVNNKKELRKKTDKVDAKGSMTECTVRKDTDTV